ncbi:hypothetical protein MHYP_G00153650 [Metynnis hypsauchen]
MYVLHIKISSHALRSNARRNISKLSVTTRLSGRVKRSSLRWQCKVERLSASPSTLGLWGPTRTVAMETWPYHTELNLQCKTEEEDDRKVLD